MTGRAAQTRELPHMTTRRRRAPGTAGLGAPVGVGTRTWEEGPGGMGPQGLAQPKGGSGLGVCPVGVWLRNGGVATARGVAIARGGCHSGWAWFGAGAWPAVGAWFGLEPAPELQEPLRQRPAPNSPWGSPGW